MQKKKVLFIGGAGSGKTSLIRALTGECPTEVSNIISFPDLNLEIHDTLARGLEYDLALCVYDCSSYLSYQTASKLAATVPAAWIIMVGNKCDLAPPHDPSHLVVSARTGQGIEQVRKELLL